MSASESHESQNIIIGKLALDSGYVTPEQLRASLSLQARAHEIGLREELLEIFVKKGFLDEGQAAKLREEAGRLDRRKTFERKLAREVVSRGWVAEDSAMGTVASFTGTEEEGLENRLLEEGDIDRGTFEHIRRLRQDLAEAEAPDPALQEAATLPPTLPPSPGDTVPPGQGRPGSSTSLPGVSPPPDLDGDVEGVVLGDYRIVGELGRGAMGVVYEARQISLKRKVALKVLPPELVMNEQRVGRFLREAEAAAALDHPGVVKVYGMGEEGGIHFFAMQYVAGKDLENLVATERVSFRQAAKIVREAAEALDYAHGQGVIHRDIKPANIMMADAGKVMIMDFGLARHAEGESSLTASGAVMGTPAFMSPEQARGDKKALDHRTDIYSLGATLHFLITGAAPFDIDGSMGLHAVLRMILETDPVPPRRRIRTVPAALETIVLKALAKSPARRYQKARELAEDLDRYLAGEPILARAPGTIEKMAWKVRKRKWSVLAGVLVLAALAALYPIWRAGAAGARREKPREKLAQARAALEKGDGEKAAATASYVLENVADPGLRLEAQALVTRSWEGRDEAAFLRACARLWAMDRTGAEGAWARLRLAEHLYGRSLYQGADRLLAALLPDLPAGSDLEARARLLAARTAFAQADYNRAAEAYRSVHERFAAGLGDEEKAEARTRLRRLDLFTPSVTLPLPAIAACTGDLDGDGETELLAVTRKKLHAYVRQGAELVLRRRWVVPGLGRNDLQALCTADLDGDGRQELFLCAGRSAARVAPGTEGFLAAFREEEGELRRLWAEPMTTTVRPRSFGVSDLDEDGKPELVLGLSFYARHLLFLKHDGETYRIYARIALPQPRRASDVHGVALADLDGDGADEVVVSLGPWNAYGVAVLEQALPWRPPYPVVEELYALGQTSDVTAGPFGAGGSPLVAVGKMHTVNKKLFGPEAPLGPVDEDDLVVLRWNPSGLRKVTGLDLGPNERNLGVLSVVSADLTGDGRYEIVVLAELPPEGAVVRQELSALRLTDAEELEKEVLFEARGRETRFTTLFTGDADGDGRAELLLAGTRLVVLGFDGS